MLKYSCGSLCSVLLWAGLCTATHGQVTPDNTLSTTITSTDNLNFIIENGDTAGNNLFHSFDEFSIPTGGSASFNNATDIGIIFSRVTGRNISDIDGSLSANGTADVYLLNPNGIVFGPNASLDIGGSFLATTADRILFENDQFFSATDTATAPLLTVSTPIGVQFGTTQNSITVQGNGNNLTVDDDPDFLNLAIFPDRANRPVGLAVNPTQTLGLLGGDIQFEGGNITAEQGRIELGSVTQSGVVSLEPVAEGFTLGYDAIDSFGTIRLEQASSIDVSGDGSGHLHIQAGTLSILEDSVILSDVLGAEDGGDVLLRASDTVEIAGPEVGDFYSWISNTTERSSAGTVGTFSIETDTLTISDGARINASTYGEGSGGDVTLEANTIDIAGLSSDGASVPGIFLDTFSSTKGRNLVVNTDSLSVRDTGHMAAGTFGDGDGGDFSLTANTIELSGLSPNDVFLNTGLFVDTRAAGKGGNLTIDTQRLSLTNEAAILGAASTGDGGTVTIRADEVSLSDGSFISLFGSEGDAGDLIIQANTLDIDGVNPFSNGFSGLFVSAGGAGRGGDIVLEVDQLSVTDGGAIVASTFGSGDAGTINIQANTMEISGAALDFTGSLNGVVSSVSAGFGDSFPPATGNGGDIIITANQLVLSKGGQIDASTFGEGDGGSITLNVDALTLDGISDVLSDGTQSPSQILASSETDTAAGSVNITGDRLTVQNGAEISVSGLSTGDAGNLILNGDTIRLNNGGRLLAEVNGGEQGNIQLSANDVLILRRGSAITATASGQSTGGNIAIRTPFVVAISDENSDIAANAVQGDGGNISITAQNLFGITPRNSPTPDSDITASSEFGLNGTVEINDFNTDPDSGLVELPSGLVDSSDQIAKGCTAIEGNTFTLTGRGGIAADPTGLLDGDRPWQDMRDLSAFLNNPSENLVSPPTEQSTVSEPFQEATGMAIAPNGEVQLLTSNANSVITNHPTCTSNPNVS